MIAKKTIVPNLDKPGRKDMHEESSHKFKAMKRHKFLPAAVAVVLVGKSDQTGILIKGLDAGIRYGNLVGVPCKILDYIRRRIKRLLNIDYKGLFVKAPDKIFSKRELPLKVFYKNTSKDRRKNLNGQKELIGRAEKPSVVGRQTAGRDHDMKMRMILQGLTPGVKNSSKTRGKAKELL